MIESVPGSHGDLVFIDAEFQGVAGAIGTWLVPATDGWVLVDCGPTTCKPVIERTLADAGIEARDISRIVLTHIHLDHAGGAGAWIRDYPHLRITVHPDAAQFLINPARLVASATKSFGDRMDALWGDVVPVPADHIDGAIDGECAHGARLRAIASPGHTGTHMAWLHEPSGTLFTGDAAHARVPGSRVIVPTLVPVELDFDQWRSTQRRLQQLNSSALALPHAGLFTDAEDHLAQITDRIEHRLAIAREVYRSPDDLKPLEQALYAATRAEVEAEGTNVEATLAALELSMPSYLGAQGIARWHKVHGGFV